MFLIPLYTYSIFINLLILTRCQRFQVLLTFPRLIYTLEKLFCYFSSQRTGENIAFHHLGEKCVQHIIMLKEPFRENLYLFYCYSNTIKMTKIFFSTSHFDFSQDASSKYFIFFSSNNFLIN